MVMNQFLFSHYDQIGVNKQLKRSLILVHGLRGYRSPWHGEGVHGERILWLRLFTSPQTRKQERSLQEELYPLGLKDPRSGCVFLPPGLTLSENAPRDTVQGVAH